jgi:O-methyltransferase involved in polyketide biosynthesis
MTMRTVMSTGDGGQNQAVACAGPRRKAAHRALSSVVVDDTIARCLAGPEYVDSVQQQLMEYGKIQGMRAVYNRIESDCIAGHWMNMRMHDFLQQNTSVQQIVLLKCGMDSRVYNLHCLQGRSVFEVDDAGLLFLKQHMLSMYSGSQTTQALIKRCSCAMDDDAVMSDQWLRSLRDNGWSSEQPSIFVLDGAADSMTVKALQHMLLIMKEQCCSGRENAVLFDTSRMMDEKRRLQNWLLALDLDMHVLDTLDDKTIHGGILSITEPNFKNRYLVMCQF